MLIQKSTKRSQPTTETAVSAGMQIASGTLFSACESCTWTLTTCLLSHTPRARSQQKKRHDGVVAAHKKSKHSLAHCKPSGLGSMWPVTDDGFLRSHCHRCNALIQTPGAAANKTLRNEQQRRHGAKLERHTCASREPRRRDTPRRAKPVLAVFEGLSDDRMSFHARDAARRCRALHAEERTQRQNNEAKVYAWTPAAAATLLKLLDLHVGARLLYVGCGWGEVVLAWVLAWASEQREDLATAGEILLEVHAIDVVRSSVAIFREALAGVAMDASARASIEFNKDTVIVANTLRIVVRAHVL